MRASKPAMAMAALRPAAVALAWKTTSASATEAASVAKARAERRRNRAPRRIDVDHRDLGAGQPRGEARDQQADDASADHRDAVPRPRA